MMDIDETNRESLHFETEIKLDHQKEFCESCNYIHLNGINYKGNRPINKFEGELNKNVKNNLMDLNIFKNNGECKMTQILRHICGEYGSKLEVNDETEVITEDLWTDIDLCELYLRSNGKDKSNDITIEGVIENVEIKNKLYEKINALSGQNKNKLISKFMINSNKSGNNGKSNLSNFILYLKNHKFN